MRTKLQTILDTLQLEFPIKNAREYSNVLNEKVAHFTIDNEYFTLLSNEILELGYRDEEGTLQVLPCRDTEDVANTLASIL